MTVWTERVQSHAAFVSLSNVEQAVAQIEPMVAVAPQPDVTLAEFDRVRQVVSLTRRVLDDGDPNLVSMSALGSVQNALDQIGQHLGNFRGNPAHPSYLEQANTSVDTLLAVLALFPTVREETDARGIREAISSFRLSVSQHLRHATDELKALATSVTDVRAQAQTQAAELATQKGRLDTLINDQTQQFSTAQASRNTEFNQGQTTRSTEFATAQDARQVAASTSLTEQRERFDKLIVDQREEYQTLLREAAEARADTERVLKSQAMDLLASLEAELKEAQKIVGIIGQTGMQAGFQRVANHERLASWVWNAFAVGGFAGLIYVAMTVVLPTVTGSFEWPMFAGRVFVSLTFGAFAGYAARQATQHQQSERRARQMQLEMASLGPFLAPLKEADQHLMIQKLADRMFAQPPAPEKVAKNNLPASVMLDMLKAVADLKK